MKKKLKEREKILFIYFIEETEILCKMMKVKDEELAELGVAVMGFS